MSDDFGSKENGFLRSTVWNLIFGGRVLTPAIKTSNLYETSHTDLDGSGDMSIASTSESGNCSAACIAHAPVPELNTCLSP